jgi:hypothetical protein
MLNSQHTDYETFFQAELPTELPSNIDEIRTIRTHHYKWCFSVHDSTRKKWIDIRKPRGRLAVLDLIYYPAVSRNRYVLRAGIQRAALNEISPEQNVEVQPVEAESANGWLRRSARWRLSILEST